MSWCGVPDVQAQTQADPPYADDSATGGPNGTGTTKTKPGLVEVMKFIGICSSIIDATLRANNYDPARVVDETGLDLLRYYNACGAGAMAERSRPMMSEKDEKVLARTLQREFEMGLKMIATKPLWLDGSTMTGSMGTSSSILDPAGYASTNQGPYFTMETEH